MVEIRPFGSRYSKSIGSKIIAASLWVLSRFEMAPWKGALQGSIVICPGPKHSTKSGLNSVLISEVLTRNLEECCCR